MIGTVLLVKQRGEGLSIPGFLEKGETNKIAPSQSFLFDRFLFLPFARNVYLFSIQKGPFVMGQSS